MADQAFAGLLESTGGSFSYNGHNFDGAYNIKVAILPVYDEADRVRTHDELTITVTGVLQNDAQVNEDMHTVRKKILEPGQKLSLENKGLGRQLSLQPLGDVVWGPKPRMIQWEPVGDNLAVQIIWQVVLHISPCDTTAPAHGRLMAFNYEAAYSIDEQGDTTRTITGYLQIAQTRGAGNVIGKTADQFRHNVNVEPLLGFSRTQNWTTSKDKNRLDFTITDTQIPSPNPYPADMPAIQGRHRVRWNRRSLSSYIGTISMDITPKAQISGSAAWAMFLVLAGRRISLIRNMGGGNRFVMLQGVETEDNLFGRPVSFSVSYRLIANANSLIDMGRMAVDNALWASVGTSWQEWNTSLEDSMFNRRGNAELALLPSSDTLVNLCHGTPPTITGGQAPETPDESPSTSKLGNTCPPKSDSWVDYKSVIKIHRLRPVQRQSYVQDPDYERGGGDDAYSPIVSGSDYTTGPPQGFNDVIQEGGTSRYTVVLIGRAERFCYKIPRPILHKVGTQDVVEVRGEFNHWVSEVLPVKKTVYKAVWRIEYQIVNSPGTVAPPVDKRFGVGGNEEFRETEA